MILGIDLGTTYSAAAYMDENGEPQIIENQDGDRTTPSVFFEEAAGEITIGQSAKDNAILRPQDVIDGVKNKMGKEYEYITSSGNKYVPEQISSYIIRKIVQDAELAVGEKIKDVVITIPAYFGQAERKATEDAARIAGVRMVGCINEPTAAVLSYQRKNKIEDGYLMIYDLGGGTFDVSIAQIEKGKATVRATDGIPRTGGYFFDQDIILSYISDLLLDKYDIDLESDEYLEERQELQLKAERCKIQLSSRKSVTIPIRIGEVKESVEITREYFNQKLTRFYNNTQAKMRNALRMAGITAAQLDTVLMVGGSSRIPFIEEKVREFTGKEPARDINPDEAVAIGAAIYGKQHEEEVKEMYFQDINSHSIGFIHMKPDKSRENCMLIKKNSPLLATAKQTVLTVIPNQSKIELPITEGEGADIQYVKVLTVIDFKLPRGLTKGTEVVITYEQDEYQLLHIELAIPSVEGCRHDYVIERESNLTEEDIAAMTSVALSTVVN